ncbi:hypothetical protein EV360DRAFT_88435 [Lentinula raphanica]|nr:hypothetical protein EV360DRAFT_88435 [Lentinula raphanica]
MPRPKKGAPIKSRSRPSCFGKEALSLLESWYPAYAAAGNKKRSKFWAGFFQDYYTKFPPLSAPEPESNSSSDDDPSSVPSVADGNSNSNNDPASRDSAEDQTEEDDTDLYTRRASREPLPRTGQSTHHLHTGLRSGATFSPWEDAKIHLDPPLKPKKPFLLKKRFAEQFESDGLSAPSDEAETDIDEVDEYLDLATAGTDLPAPSGLDPLLELNHLSNPTNLQSVNARKDIKNRAKRKSIRMQTPSKTSALSDSALCRCQTSTTIQTEYGLRKDAKIGSGGYSGKKRDLEPVCSSMEELRSQGIEIVDWHPEKGFVALLDSEDYVAVVLGGWPKETNWAKVNSEASTGIKAVRQNLHFTSKQTENRRTPGPSVPFGISFGGGATRPGNLRQSSKSAYRILEALLGLLAFVRIVGSSNTLFMAYAYRTYEYNRSTLRALCDWNPKLHQVFKKSVWAASTSVRKW